MTSSVPDFEDVMKAIPRASDDSTFSVPPLTKYKLLDHLFRLKEYNRRVLLFLTHPYLFACKEKWIEKFKKEGAEFARE